MTGKECRRKRERADLSQMILAYYAGITYQNLSDYENGKLDLPAEVVGKLAQGVIALPERPYKEVKKLEREARAKFGIVRKKNSVREEG